MKYEPGINFLASYFHFYRSTVHHSTFIVHPSTINLSSVLETLITSKTRIKLLLKFFLNSNSSSYLRGLESEFGESTNAIRLELNRFEDAGLLSTSIEGNKKMFQANTQHPLFGEIHNQSYARSGFDQIIDKIINKLGDLKMVFVVGDFAKGKDSQIIDLLFVGDSIDREYLTRLVERSEKLISRKIRSLIYTSGEFNNEFRSDTNKDEMLLLWKEENPNHIE